VAHLKRSDQGGFAGCPANFGYLDTFRRKLRNSDSESEPKLTSDVFVHFIVSSITRVSDVYAKDDLNCKL